MARRIVVLMRRISDALTGRRRCSYHSRHGHDLTYAGSIDAGPAGRVVFFRCAVCGIALTADRWTPGLSIAHDGWTPDRPKPPTNPPRRP